MGGKGSGRRPGEPRAAGAGRPAKKVELRDGAKVLVRSVGADGGAGIGRLGTVAVEKDGAEKIVKIYFEDGERITILI